MDNLEMESHDKSRMLGVYKMVHDIQDKEYITPLKTLKEGHKHARSPTQDNSETNTIIWWVVVVILGFMLILYSAGVYFTYIDDAKGFNSTFNNLERLTKIDIQQKKER